ncbi:RusA family crossover junction endodeoxyribonuclease [Escherichia coli]|nr:RusA family crossover junction endodeoxyribonuclease [Escherichia coli]ELK7168285.1 RusA family crossover junction endodeoxyribonuclease [Escherichia coli]ELK7326240.1 RusA family crossover junction endodeoxyribonuclease [Escherichia coli]HAY4167473.1 RusA family crossover junction endodeoxyribonuclease [Escherichia coli]
MSTKLTGYVWDGCAASGMKLSSVAIMARLADFSNDEGVCWPSIETIARQIGAGMSTVRTAIARLEAEGWLTRKARRQGNRIRDLDNYNKALFDVLTHVGVWEDDSQVKRMLVEWGPVIPEGKVEITISKYEKTAGAAA